MYNTAYQRQCRLQIQTVFLHLVRWIEPVKSNTRPYKIQIGLRMIDNSGTVGAVAVFLLRASILLPGFPPDLLLHLPFFKGLICLVCFCYIEKNNFHITIRK